MIEDRNFPSLGPGRPKDLDKHLAIVTAARALFFAHGVEDVAVEHIAANAGVSKVTVYGHFGTKTAIFEAVVATELERMSRAFDMIPGTAKSLRHGLIEFGTELMTFLTNPEIMAFDKLLTAQAERHPAMALALLNAGPRHGHRKLAEHLAHPNDETDLSIPDPHKAAMQLAALWQGLKFQEQRLGVRPQPSRDEIRVHVAEGVDLLLRSYRRP
jgi:TetR/AcrR family transcriptional regulator, mexJK operon transcriptional repressor